MEYLVCLMCAIAMINAWYWRRNAKLAYRLAVENQRLKVAVDECMKELDQYKHPGNHMFLAS